jgi:hypothetical protein
MKNKDQILLEDLYISISERAFHGTPHDIVGTFDLNKIGSGEGAQAYGWGLYFAENPEVAKNYQKNLSHKDFIDKVSKAYDEYYSPEESVEALENAGLSTNQMALVNALREEDWWGFDYPHQAVRAALREPQNFEYGEEVEKALANFGNLYQVEINADKENDFLQWDKPLNQQSEKIKNALKEYIEFCNRWEWNDDLKKVVDKEGYGEKDPFIAFSKEQLEEKKYGTGGDIYFTLSNYYNSKKEASNYLKNNGIKGIRYLDQASRRVGEGTYNYVIFDPSIIQIVSKNGEFVMSSKKPENVEI